MRRALVISALILAGCSKPTPPPVPKPFPKVVVTTKYIEGVAPTVRRKIRVVDGDVEPWMLDGAYPHLRIPSLAQYLERYADWEKRAKIYDGRVTVLLDRRVTFGLAQEVIETCRASGYPTTDVIVAENELAETAAKR